MLVYKWLVRNGKKNVKQNTNIQLLDRKDVLEEAWIAQATFIFSIVFFLSKVSVAVEIIK